MSDVAAPVRLGIVGLGNMGRDHAKWVSAGQIPGLVLGAVADTDEARASAYGDVPTFTSAQTMFESGAIDAALIATPHFSHVPLGIAALDAGLHTVVEKPIAATIGEARRLVDAHFGREHLVFGAMFNQRTDPAVRELRRLLLTGELGVVQRINWTVTTWFRPDVYYASGTWRATWSGEGGGVLLNQAPHQLDLLWWLFGPVTRVQADCRFGCHHDIEVEDEVSALLRFANGSSGVFVTSTGESPGTNRLEVTGDRGRAVLETALTPHPSGDATTRLTIDWTNGSVSEFRRTTPNPFGRPSFTTTVSEPFGPGGQHRRILTNFGAAIRDGAPLIAPAAEGVHSVELANAMLLSAWTDETIALPLDADRYAALLGERQRSLGTATGLGRERPRR